MPLRNQSGDSLVLREEVVGSSRNRICYPGISSCITITGVMPGGLVGTHLTVASEPTLIDAALLALKAGGGGACTSFYVVGAIARFKENTGDPGFNTRKKIRDKICKHINKDARVRFFDTSAHHVDVHVFAERNRLGTVFSYTPTTGIVVSGNNYPNVGNRTFIEPHQYVIR